MAVGKVKLCWCWPGVKLLQWNQVHEVTGIKHELETVLTEDQLPSCRLSDSAGLYSLQIGGNHGGKTKDKTSNTQPIGKSTE